MSLSEPFPLSRWTNNFLHTGTETTVTHGYIPKNQDLLMKHHGWKEIHTDTLKLSLVKTLEDNQWDSLNWKIIIIEAEELHIQEINLLKHQILQIIITELTLGPMHNMKKTIQPNGLPRPKPKLTVLMMLSCKDPLQLSQIITTESMPGLIHNTKKLTLLNGRLRLLKLLKVDTTLLPKD